MTIIASSGHHETLKHWVKPRGLCPRRRQDGNGGQSGARREGRGGPRGVESPGHRIASQPGCRQSGPFFFVEKTVEQHLRPPFEDAVPRGPCPMLWQMVWLQSRFQGFWRPSMNYKCEEESNLWKQSWAQKSSDPEDEEERFRRELLEKVKAMESREPMAPRAHDISSLTVVFSPLLSSYVDMESVLARVPDLPLFVILDPPERNPSRSSSSTWPMICMRCRHPK